MLNLSSFLKTDLEENKEGQLLNAKKSSKNVTALGLIIAPL
jgi:hypothetical protein